MKPCANPVALEKLIAYWLGEIEDEALEEHFLGCAFCAKRLESLAAYAQGIKALVQAGRLGVALTPGLLEHLKQAGFRIREYRAAPGETVHCSIRAEDDAVVSRLKVPLAGVKRVDALRSVEVGGTIERRRVEDVPFDAETGEILLMPSAAELRKMPAHTWRAQLVAVEESGERPLGEYTFRHSA